MYNFVSKYVILLVLICDICRGQDDFPEGNLPALSLDQQPDQSSSTLSPQDAFLNAIKENAEGAFDEAGSVLQRPVEQLDPPPSPFGNFDLDPQYPTPSQDINYDDPTIDQVPSFGDYDETGGDYFEPPQQDRRPSRPMVDAFGNPLGEIHSVDTTRYELGGGGNPERLRCPRNWEKFRDSCYKFTRSPPKRWDDARELCQAFRHNDQDHADLASVDTFEEHRFITNYLNKNDPQHRRWYISTRQENQNQWINRGDNTPMLNLQNFFLKSNEWGEFEGADYKKDYLVYAFSLSKRQWGFQPVFGHEEYLYICEVPIEEIKYLINDDRNAGYGELRKDPRYVEMGPYFVRQPNHTVFDISRRNIVHDVDLLCIAHGWPTPAYNWYKEVYINDTLTEQLVDPLKDSRITVSGGQLIINSPDQTVDKGTYFCTASNKFGTIRSRSVSLAFSFIGEFILRRSNEVGRENWGKAISCDPPHHFPDVKYYWARNYFPNFVEEDRRVMVSFDGYLYITALENIDRGSYSCNVQSAVSNTGRNGPFFQIEVLPHPNHQQLRFPQNFPKSFPEAPVAGEDVRLECIAFGYPVPHYNWTRVNSPLPRGSYITNFNRVLIIPKVRVEDQGEYICTAKNDKVSIKETLTLSIQSRPLFTIPIGDQYVDENDEVVWSCEAFGIPDVTYAWLRDGKPLTQEMIAKAPEDRGRYEIRDNVLKIKQVRKDRDEGMYQCAASNDLDTRHSSGQLKVLTLPPSFVKHPLDERIFAARDGNVTIECEPEAAPRPNITWYRNGEKLGTGGKVQIFRSGIIYIKGLNSADGGQYECLATNKYGTARSRTQLVIMDGPSFKRAEAVKPSPRIIVTTGETVSLRCLAGADDILDRAYYWRLNGDLLEFVDDYEIERILELKNAGGSRISMGANADSGVHAIDIWSAFNPRDLQAQTLTANWINVETIRNKGTGDFQRFWRDKQDGFMKIRNISIAESGTYECAVETVVGTIYATSEVIVHSVPGPPGGVTAVKLTEKSGTVVWTDGAFYGLRIKYYKIEGRTDHNQTWVVLADRVEGEEIEYQSGRPRVDGRRKYRLEGNLSPWAAYSFRVAAYNQEGLGEWSEPSPQYNTRPDKPYKSVNNIHSDGGRTGDLTVRWTPLPRQDQNAPGIYYRVYYRRTGIDPERDFQQKTLRHLGNIDMHVIRVPHKYFFTTYEIKIQVFNDKCQEPECQGPISDPVTVMTAEDLPQVAPSYVGARPFNSTAINVTWTAIPNVREKLRGKLIGHRIRYWRQDLNEVTDAQFLLSRSTEPHALIIGLLPNKYYWVRVMAYNSAGPGPESERFLERTFKLRPQKAPTAVQVFGINPSTIRVTWRYISPTVEEEPLTGYKIRVWESDKDISLANDTLVYIGSKLEAVITDLTPGKSYYLRVLAFSQGGEGKMSSPAWQFQMGDPDKLNAAPSMRDLSSAIVLATCLMLSSRQVIRQLVNF